MSFPLHRFLVHLVLGLLLSNAILVFGQGQIIIVDVDDTDAGIEYSSGWVSLSEGSNDTLDGTEHLSRIQGGTANFTFTGIGVSVFGSIVPLSTFAGSPTTSTYFLDDEPGQSFTAPVNITETQNKVLFYQSPVVSNGTHTLRIVNDNEDDWYFLDFLEILSFSPDGSSSNDSVLTQTTSGSITSSSSASKSNSHTVMTSSTKHELGQTPVSFSSHTQSVSPGAAIGIAFSGAIILALAVTLVIFICLRRRRRNTDLARLEAIDPFVRGFVTATNDRKGGLSPPASPAAVETSAHGMFYPYLVEFFSRSRGPQSLRNFFAASGKSVRSAKLNVSPSSPLGPPPQPELKSLPTQPPVPATQIQIQTQTQRPARRSTRRSTKSSFFTSLSRDRKGNEGLSPTTTLSTNVQMGVAM